MELPNLEEFRMVGVAFPLVDPSELPPKWERVFDEFMRGQSVPHPVYVYAHDWNSFCVRVKQGDIKID